MGLVGLTRVLAVEGAKNNIKANVVAPIARTRMTEELLGRGLVPTAAVGGLVEAFEATDQRWVLGVQWHPERTAEVSPEARRIFDAFVAAAARTTASAR